MSNKTKMIKTPDTLPAIPPNDYVGSVTKWTRELQHNEEDEKQFVTSEDLIEEGRKQGMIQGIALALSYMYRGNDEEAIWRSAGLTVQICIDNEVDSFDMEMILQHQKELEG